MAQGDGFGVLSSRVDRHFIDGNLGTSATSPAATYAGRWLAFPPAGESGPFNITLPAPSTSLAGTVSGGSMPSSIWAQADPTGVAGYATTTETGSYGLAFTVAASGTLQTIWFYSVYSATTLPSETSLWTTTNANPLVGSLVAQNNSPTWSGAAGSGWVYDTSFPATPVSPGTYYVAQYYGSGLQQAYLYTGSSPAAWFPSTSGDGNITAPEFVAGSAHPNAGYVNSSDAFPGTYLASNINWLADVGISFSGGGSESGPFNPVLPAPKTTLTGAVAHAGGFNVTLPPPKTTLTGVVAHAGGFHVTLPPPKTTLTGVVAHAGGFSVVLPPPRTSLAGTVAHQGSFTITLPAPRTSLAAQITHKGSFTITLPAPFTSLSGSVTSPGEAGAFNITLPAPRTSLSAAVTHKGSFNLTLPVPHLSLSGAPGHNGSFNITLPAPHSSLTAATGHKGSFTITLPALKVSLAGQAGHKGSFTITLPVLHTSLSGTVSPSGSGGPLVAALLSGTVTIPEYAGTITIAPYAGTVTSGGPVVPLQQDLNGQIVNNTVVAEIEVTYQGAPLSLSGYTLKVVLKMNRTVADSTGVTFTIGSGIVITDSAEGQFTLTVPYADLPNPATMWYRCDVIDVSENPYTALYGNFQVLAA